MDKKRSKICAELNLSCINGGILSKRRDVNIMIISIKRIVRAAIICAVFYIILGAILPLVYHKKPNTEAAQKLPVYGPEEYAERVLAIDDNMDALLWRLRVIDTAQEEIILSTLDLRDDESGKIIMSALYNAAQRDISVKLLLDGLNYTFHLAGSDTFKALISHPNVEARAYNTLTLAKPWDNHFRLHDKYLIADSTAYILGGRNTHDLFLGDFCEKKNIDMDILVYAETVSDNGSLSQLRAYFEEVWALPCCKELEYNGEKSGVISGTAALNECWDAVINEYPSAFGYSDWSGDTVPSGSITLLTNPIEPNNKEPQLWQALVSLMSEGEDVIIETPYIIPNSYMYDSLKALCSDSTVKIVTNSAATGANIWGCADYMNNKTRLIRLGADIYEFAGDSSSHMKSIVIDGSTSIVGSFNFDMRSAYLDTELMLVIDSEELACQLRKSAETSISKSRLALPDGSYIYGENCTYPAISAGKKLFYSLLRIIILPIRHLL